MIKYTIPLRDYSDVAWRVNIYSDSYSGQPLTLKGVGDQAFLLDYDGDTDDPFSVYIKSTLTLNLYNEGQVDINELQNASDMDYKIEIQKGNSLYWVGYLIPENIQQPLKSTPYSFSLSAIDGLSMLEDMDYVHNNLPGITYEPNRSPMNYIRQILFSKSNLGLNLPIRWTNNLRCTAFEGQDVFIGAVRWSPRGEGFFSYQENGAVKKCGYILEGILKSMQCRIYQANGRWVIRRINDYISGQFKYIQIPGNLGVMVLTTGTEVIAKKIGSNGYPFIYEDALMTNISALKSFKTTYNANVRENILPNGDQDITSLAQVLYWGFYDPTGTFVQTYDALDGRGKNASQLTNISGEDKYFTLISQDSEIQTGGLPIDAHTLLKRVNFSFMFLPLNGFTFNTDTGFIIWDDKPLQLQIVLNQGANQYFLDEFGIWRTDVTFIAPTVEALKIGDVAKVNFDKFQGIILPDPGFQPSAGDVCDIKVIFVVRSGQSYVVDNISFTIANSNDVYVSSLGALKNTKHDETTLNISSSFGGYMLSNFMSNWDRSDSESEYQDGSFYTGTLTGLNSNARMRLRYLPSKIFNGNVGTRKESWSFDEIYTIEYYADRRFMPLNAKYNIEKCEVNLVAIESRNDDIALTEKFYGSNDEQLSN